MHHEIDALVRQGRRHRISVGWFTGLALAGLPLVGAASCTAGELNDRQEKFLRRELDKDYPATEAPANTSTEDPDPTTEAPAETSSEPAATSDTTTTQVTTTEQSSSDVVTSEASSSATSSEGATSSEAPASTIPDCAMQVFHTTCSGSVCHYQGAVNLPPNFETTDDIFTMLTTSETGCDDAVSPLYVDVTNPQNSYLLVKLKGQQPSGCGTPMPPDQTTITQDEITCLEDWIGSL